MMGEMYSFDVFLFPSIMLAMHARKDLPDQTLLLLRRVPNSMMRMMRTTMKKRRMKATGTTTTRLVLYDPSVAAGLGYVVCYVIFEPMH